MVKRHYIRHLLRDLVIITASIFVAVLLVKAGVVDNLINPDASIGFKAFSSFLAGAFFTSVFTVAPAGVALISISHSFSPFYVAFFGALGAMIIDLMIITFVRKDINEGLDSLSKMAFKRHLIKAFHFGFLKWVVFVIGMIVIASPLPDEPGLFLLSVSKVNPRIMPVVFFTSNFLGIWLLVTIAAAI